MTKAIILITLEMNSNVPRWLVRLSLPGMPEDITSYISNTIKKHQTVTTYKGKMLHDWVTNKSTIVPIVGICDQIPRNNLFPSKQEIPELRSHSILILRKVLCKSNQSISFLGVYVLRDLFILNWRRSWFYQVCCLHLFNKPPNITET